MKPLNARERAFVAAFMGIAKGNATEAAVIAGYSKDRNVAHVQGYRLLHKATVQKAIVKRVEAREAKGIATADERDRLMSEMMRNPGLEPRDRRAAVVELNKVDGRYSITHILKGRLTIVDALEEAAKIPLEQARKALGE